MNVKANMRISQLPEVEEMFVCPSCGDESLSLGAVWVEYYRRQAASEAGRRKHPLVHGYLGGDFTEREIQSAMEAKLVGSGCIAKRFDNVEDEVARLLSKNRAVARFAGRMEWGARALGNRSILANPAQWRNVEKINSMIKLRDFWMPFAPSMMADKQDRYLRNPKSLHSPFMMFAFETKPIAEEHLGAAIHPRDRTARAQLVTSEQNPRYYRLLQHYESLTGASGVLNTSFNLHGFPLVYSPTDAIDVFLRSGLDCLALEGHLITKPASAETA